MDKFIEAAPSIIEEAAKSTLGLFALMVIALSIIGFLFFRESSERTRIGMFLLMFTGVVTFGIASFRATSQSPPFSSSPGAPSGGDIDVSGKWTATVRNRQGHVYDIYFTLDGRNGNLLGDVSYPSGRGGILDGSIDGDRISFMTKHTPRFETEKATISFDGKVVGDTIHFVMQSESGFEKFTATRSQP